MKKENILNKFIYTHVVYVEYVYTKYWLRKEKSNLNWMNVLHGTVVFRLIIKQIWRFVQKSMNRITLKPQINESLPRK